MRKLFITLLAVVALTATAQVTTIPAILQQGYTGEVTLIYNPNEGDKGLADATECYLYSCVELDHNGKWVNELAAWPSKSEKTKMTKSGSNWTLTIPNLFTFYNVPSGKTITKILVLFTDGKKDGKSGRGVGGADIIIELAEPGLSASIVGSLPELSTLGSTASLSCHATESATLTLKLNGQVVKTGTGTEMSYMATFSTAGENVFELTASADGQTATATAKTYVAAAPTKQARPTGIVNGIYYNSSDPTKVTLCTYAGSKTEPAKHVFILGDFNNWTISNDYQMKQATDSAYFWHELSGLVPGKEYAFQYLVVRADGVVKRICDLYSEKVLTWDDQWEPKKNDPTLMPYPSKADGSFVTVIQTNKSQYQWSEATLNFQRPDKNNLVIYELWVYDYTHIRTLKGVRERLDYIQQLGVNAIELMPMCEFDGNYNWGYSPCLYFAVDKAYATPNQFKEFIDECHQRGMAVIMDMVFNHATGNNPMNKLYPPSSGGAGDLANNPWFNVNAPHPDNVYEDWNHDFPPAHTMFIRALQYWLKEYKVDGYRLDLSHGLCGKNYNAVTNLKDYYQKGVKAVSPDAYMILEHWGNSAASDWPKLVNEGMLCWQNTSNAYCQTSMGWLKDGDSFNDANKGDGYITYCESHDEERMQYKAKMWGAGDMTSKEATRLDRIAANVLMNVLLDGSHMMWQYEEIGYDFSINSDIDHPNASDESYRCNKKPRPEERGYFSQPNRVAAYAKCAQGIQLRTRIMPEVFAGNPTASMLNGGVKVRNIQWGNEVYVVANFDIAEQSASLPSGTWYDYFANGTQTSGSITLKAGEVKIFTGRKVALPEIDTNLEELLAIGEVESNEPQPKAMKIMRNGQVLIIRGDKVYTITGMEVR